MRVRGKRRWVLALTFVFIIAMVASEMGHATSCVLHSAYKVGHVCGIAADPDL